MPILYIAGPYSAPTKSKRDLNIEAARAAAIRAWANGWTAITPHLNTSRFDDYLDLDNERYIQGDLEIIHRLDPARGDALYLLPGWENSKGATAEFHRAFARKLPIHIGCVPTVPDKPLPDEERPEPTPAQKQQPRIILVGFGRVRQ